MQRILRGIASKILLTLSSAVEVGVSVGYGLPPVNLHDGIQDIDSIVRTHGLGWDVVEYAIEQAMTRQLIVSAVLPRALASEYQLGR